MNSQFYIGNSKRSTERMEHVPSKIEPFFNNGKTPCYSSFLDFYTLFSTNYAKTSLNTAYKRAERTAERGGVGFLIL